jgi:hypothetical protein
MSYRNPEQVVDRQSGQYIRQMQQSVAGSFEKLANKISADNKERARKNEIMIREAEKRSEAAAQSIYQAQSKNKSINFNGLNDQIDILNSIYKIPANERSQEDKNFIRNMQYAGTHISDVLQNTSAGQQEYLEKRSIPMGNQGGFSLANKPENLEALDILYGFKDAPGRKEARYDMSGPDGPVVYIDIYNEDDKLVGSIINKDMSTIAQPEYVPNLSKQTTDTQKLLEDKLDLNAVTSMVYANSEPKQFKAKNGTIYYTRLPDKEYIKNQAREDVNAVIVGLPTDEAITFYNDVLSKGNMDMEQRSSWSQERDKDGNLIPDPDLVKIQEAYLNYVVDTNAKFNTSKNFGTTKPSDYKPTSFDKKASNSRESAKIIVDDLRRYARERKLPNTAVDFGQGVEEITSTVFENPAEEGGMGKVKILTTTKSGQKAGEFEDLERTIDLDTKDGMMQYAKAMIKAGEGSSSEKNAKIEAIRKILSKKSGGKYDNL